MSKAASAGKEPTNHRSDALQENVPLLFRDAIRAHGIEHVYQTGLDTLGYPLEWANTDGEILRVVKALLSRGRKDTK